MKKIGAHNTMTYLEPTKWWGKLVKWFYRCQKLSLIEQLKGGLRVFDLRTRQNKEGNWIFAHGLVEFKGLNLFEALLILNTYKCKVRLIWEVNRDTNAQEIKAFWELCEYIRKKYPNITFFEGRRKWDWRMIYNFFREDGNPDGQPEGSLTTDQFVGSMESAFIGQVCPELWTWLNRKKTRKMAEESTAEIVLLDFIKDGEFSKK